MNNHTEDINENEDATKKSFGKPENLLPKSGFFMDEIEKDLELTNLQLSNTHEYILLTTNTKLTYPEIDKYWKAFKINNLSKHEWKKSIEELISHFRSSLKLQLQNGTKSINNSGGRKLSPSEQREEIRQRRSN